jgi:hypothetical protein
VVGPWPPKVLPKGDTNVTMKEGATGDSAASTGLAGGAFPSTIAADDDVIMVEPGMLAICRVSLVLYAFNALPTLRAW